MKFIQTDFIEKIDLKGKTHHLFNLNLLEKKGIANMGRLPFSIKILVENLLRKFDGKIVGK